MVEEINEIAIIFQRKKEEEYDTIEEYIPYKVVEGYFYEEEGCFIDTEQNVYSHIASVAEVGNVMLEEEAYTIQFRLIPIEISTR